MSERIQSSFAGRFAPLGFLCSVEAFFVFLILNEWVPDALWRMEDKIAIAVGGGIVLLYILALRVYKAVARRSCLILSQFVLLAITLWALLAKGCEVAYPIVFFLLVFWQFFIFFTSYRGVLSESFSGKELMSAHGFSLALFCFFFAFNPIFLDKPISSGNYFLIVPAALAFIYSFCIRVPAIGSEHERREGSKGIFRAPHGKEGSYLLVAESMVYVWLCLFLMLWQGAGSNVHTPYFVGGLCAGSYLLAALAPIPALGLAGCALAGFAVGIFWPCALSMGAGGIKNGGMVIFALLALFGDAGCTVGPLLVGTISDAFGGELSTGILTALVFPVLLIIGVLLFKRDLKKNGKKV